MHFFCPTRIRYCFGCFNGGGVKVEHCHCLPPKFNIGFQLLA